MMPLSQCSDPCTALQRLSICKSTKNHAVYERRQEMAAIRLTCFFVFFEEIQQQSRTLMSLGPALKTWIIFTDSVCILILSVHVLNFALYPQIGHFLSPLIVFVRDPQRSLPAVRGNKARWFHMGGLPEVSRQSLPPARDTKHLWGKVCDARRNTSCHFLFMFIPFPFFPV